MVSTFYPKHFVSDNSGKEAIIQIDIGDVSIGAVKTSNQYSHDMFYLKNEKGLRTILSRIFWEYIDANQACIVGTGGTEKISFRKEIEEETIMTELVHTCCDRIVKFQKAGIPRSILFYGAPGVGKTITLRNIAKKIGLKTLRIPVSLVDKINGNIIVDSIKLFQPDVLILDDLDRVIGPAKLLDDLETYRHYLKLILATMNNPENIDPALLRPGRFDEHFQIKTCNEEVIKKLIDYDEEVFQKVKTWGVVYIKEFSNIKNVLGREEAMKSLDGLQKRWEDCLREYSEDIKDEPENPPDDKND